MKKFLNRVVLITGASRGLGREIALSFAKEGAQLILVSKRTQGLEAIAEELESYDCTPTLVPVDLSKPDNLLSLPTAIHEKFGRLDVLIGNAGVLNGLMPITHFSPRDIAKIFNVNVIANWHLLAGCEALLAQSPHPRAIFVTTDTTTTDGEPYWGPYAASKSALNTLIKTYAKEKENTNFRVNLVDPGAMNTDMYRAVMPGADLSEIPSPAECVDVFSYLASEACQETGKVFTPDNYPSVASGVS